MTSLRSMEIVLSQPHLLKACFKSPATMCNAAKTNIKMCKIFKKTMIHYVDGTLLNLQKTNLKLKLHLSMDEASFMNIMFSSYEEFESLVDCFKIENLLQEIKEYEFFGLNNSVSSRDTNNNVTRKMIKYLIQNSPHFKTITLNNFYIDEKVISLSILLDILANDKIIYLKLKFVLGYNSKIMFFIEELKKMKDKLHEYLPSLKEIRLHITVDGSYPSACVLDEFYGSLFNSLEGFNFPMLSILIWIDKDEEGLMGIRKYLDNYNAATGVQVSISISTFNLVPPERYLASLPSLASRLSSQLPFLYCLLEKSSSWEMLKNLKILEITYCRDEKLAFILDNQIVSRMAMLKKLTFFGIEFESGHYEEESELVPIKNFVYGLPKTLKVLKLKNSCLSFKMCSNRLSKVFPDLEVLILETVRLFDYQSYDLAFFKPFQKLKIVSMNCLQKKEFLFPKCVRKLIINCHTQRTQLTSFKVFNDGSFKHDFLYTGMYFETLKNTLNNGLDDSLCNCTKLKYPFNHIFVKYDTNGNLRCINLVEITDWA